ncbi:MAG: AMP-binding protein, partial [Bacteroidota bacterium]
SYLQLFRQTNQLANALRDRGIRKGDCVAIYLPMLAETAVSVLACAKLGAIIVPLFSGFGVDAIVTRLKDCDAKMLFTSDGFYRRGKVIRTKEVADSALQEVPNVEKVVVVSRLKDLKVNIRDGRDLLWDEIVEGASEDFETEQLDAEDPFMIIYTSGTTGKPKGTVHVHSGFPLKASSDMAYCFDVKDSDVLFWLTDLGWMMGPWAILGGLSLGATVFLYEGAIDFPKPDRLWQMVERHSITIMGLSPTVVRSLMRYGEDSVDRHTLRSLRILGSTGEPWNPDPWFWFFEKVGKRKCPLINFSGGTELAGGILTSFPITPMKPCAFSGAVPGMAADVFDETGQPVRGKVGELVLRQPSPGMTKGFWRDSGRYIETYWSRWEHTWVHGDWASIDEDGFWFIHGRSDDTIKVAGKRIGPAEIESALIAHPLVSESAAIGVPDPVKGESIICFCVLKGVDHAPAGLPGELKNLVAEQLGKPMVPKEIYFVKEIPKTRNAKIMRRVVRARFLGLAYGDLSSLDNLQSIEEIPVSQ